jgi:DNA-directed RNA polymerase specialized sigma24 family protein
VARIEWVEERLQNWARWSLMHGSGVLGFAGVNLEAAGMPREPYAEAPIPVSDIDASEVDEAVGRLPSELKATVVTHYLGKGGIRDKLKLLCCTEGTLHRRIGQAHRLLADHFLAQQDKQKQERARVEALQASIRP